MLIRPGRISPYRGSKRPMWPFTINIDSPQADGLVGWWPFVPLGGSTLYDLSRHLNNGAMTSMVADPWQANESLGGHGLNFDGVNDYVNVPDNGALNLTGDYSTSIWVNTNSANDAFAAMYAKTTNGSTLSHSLQFDSAGTDLHVFIGTGAIELVTGIVRTDIASAWHNIAVTRSGTSMKFYLDGLETGSLTEATNPGAGAGDLHIGEDRDLGQPHTGQISDLRFYNRGLSASEVYALFCSSTRWDLYYPLRQVMSLSVLVAAIAAGSGNSPIFRVKHKSWGYM